MTKKKHNVEIGLGERGTIVFKFNEALNHLVFEPVIGLSVAKKIIDLYLNIPTTNEKFLEYCASEGSQCPTCKSDQIEGGGLEVEGNTVVQDMSCKNCGADWLDIYTRSGFQMSVND